MPVNNPTLTLPPEVAVPSSAPTAAPSGLKRLLDWEQWPWGVFYFPLAFVWAWYCLRARTLWFFSSSNPTLTFGGFEGEGKREMYEQLPAGSFPATHYVSPADPFEALAACVLGEMGFELPFVVKPDVGMKGLLFRKIETLEQWRAYHAACPCDYLVQELAEWPLEIGVFYYRYPWKRRGVITGLTQKEPPYVVGDGRQTLSQLIDAHPRAGMIAAEMRHKFRQQLGEVLPHHQKMYLSAAANRNQGAQLTNLTHLVDERLLDLFDHLSHYNASQFYYGRWDIKCASLEDLRAGRNFTILEFNGAGAAPNHVYHCGKTLLEAYAEIVRHWQVLFEISRHNHRAGIARYWSYRRGRTFLNAARWHFSCLKAVEKTI